MTCHSWSPIPHPCEGLKKIWLSTGDPPVLPLLLASIGIFTGEASSWGVTVWALPIIFPGTVPNTLHRWKPSPRPLLWTPPTSRPWTISARSFLPGVTLSLVCESQDNPRSQSTVNSGTNPRLWGHSHLHLICSFFFFFQQYSKVLEGARRMFLDLPPPKFC